eukprot:g26178.t1
MVEGALAIAEQDKSLRKNHEDAKKKRQMAQLKLMFDELDEDGDILSNSRKALDLLTGSGEQHRRSKGKKRRTKEGEGAAFQQRFGSLSGSEMGEGVIRPDDLLQHARGAVGSEACSFTPIQHLASRVDALEQQASNMQKDTEKVLEMLKSKTKPSQQTKENASNVRRAPAVCRGRSHDEPADAPPPPEAPPPPDARSRMRKNPPVVYSWSAAPPLDEDEVVHLRRRVAQLEAELRKQQMLSLEPQHLSD